MSLPAIASFPHADHLRLNALVKSLASGIITASELAGRAYRIGNESCHRAMEELAMPQSEESLNLLEIEKVAIEKALARCKGDRLQSARILGIGKTTLYRKIRQYDLEPPHILVCPSCGIEIKEPVQRFHSRQELPSEGGRPVSGSESRR